MQSFLVFQNIITKSGMVIIDRSVVMKVTSAINEVSRPYFRQRMVP